jgi:hypothetical protein
MGIQRVTEKPSHSDHRSSPARVVRTRTWASTGLGPVPSHAVAGRGSGINLGLPGIDSALLPVTFAFQLGALGVSPVGEAG